MGLMMLFMGKGMMEMGGQHASSKGESAIPDGDPEKRLALLQAQRELLEAQVAAVERRIQHDESTARSQPGEV